MDPESVGRAWRRGGGGEMKGKNATVAGDYEDEGYGKDDA